MGSCSEDQIAEQVRFEDYAALDVRDTRIAVVSQASAKLWIGSFAAESWNVLDGGTIYDFPRTAHGASRYCNIEGVAWLDDDRLAMVSDRSKHDEQDRECATKDQMIHIVRIATSNSERRS